MAGGCVTLDRGRAIPGQGRAISDQGLHDAWMGFYTFQTC